MKNNTNRIGFDIIGERIINLKREDLKLRDKLIKKEILSNGYNKEIEALHNKNAKELSQIIDRIGYPTFDKVGKEASEAAWLIIQHSIGKPDFMKKCVILLEKSVYENKADPKNLAYLIDRIAVFEGRLQIYGTQFDWDEIGEMSPNLFDNLTKVNHRRKSIGLNTLEEQIKIIRKRVNKEKQYLPKDFKERKEEYNKWRKLVGWIKE